MGSVMDDAHDSVLSPACPNESGLPTQSDSGLSPTFAREPSSAKCPHHKAYCQSATRRKTYAPIGVWREFNLMYTMQFAEPVPWLPTLRTGEFVDQPRKRQLGGPALVVGSPAGQRPGHPVHQCGLEGSRDWTQHGAA